MSFYPGQHVVCVNTWSLERGRGYGDEVGPIRGGVYTVREVGFFNQEYAEFLQVRLVEIVNRKRSYVDTGVWEPSFDARRFRPLDESRLDIFRQHLAPVPEREPA